MKESNQKDLWLDCFGNYWPTIKSKNRLKFKYPLHAAVRKHIFHIDGYKCRACGMQAEKIPDGWDGKYTLPTINIVNGSTVLLVIDHVRSLKSGGDNSIGNFQTLCEKCNLKKLKQDFIDIRSYRGNENGAC